MCIRDRQVIAEQLSDAGVPVFMSDIKGDLSGMAQPGATNARLEERATALGITFKPEAFPVELYSLSGKLGAQMRATICLLYTSFYDRYPWWVDNSVVFHYRK